MQFEILIILIEVVCKKGEFCCNIVKLKQLFFFKNYRKIINKTNN